MKILLPTDGSDYSEGAAKFLRILNFSSDDEIDILHAINWVPVVTEWEFFYDDFKKIKDEVAPIILESTKKLLKPLKANKKTSSVEDYPDKAILDMVQAMDIELIIMGSRGIRGITSNIVGSVAKAVAVKSHVPIFIIKPPQWEIKRPIKILFATDGSDHADAMAKFLPEIPFPNDTELYILNVESSALSHIPERITKEISDSGKGIVEKAREKELRGAGDIIRKSRELIGDSFGTIREIAVSGDPAEEIINAASEAEADIIAIGGSGKRGVIQRLGRVSRYVLNHSKCSLLIGKK